MKYLFAAPIIASAMGLGSLMGERNEAKKYEYLEVFIGDKYTYYVMNRISESHIKYKIIEKCEIAHDPKLKDKIMDDKGNVIQEWVNHSISCIPEKPIKYGEEI